jgi:hypothetical protein
MDSASLPTAGARVEVASGLDRLIIDLDKEYIPYPMQAAFHSSPVLNGFLGGAAGPGKTLALIMEQMIGANEFNVDDGPHVHTLLLRRTVPKLDATVITRFREKIPKELYKNFNGSTREVVWLNGATTKFGSMQYEHNAWDYQGQWYHIGYDELCEFTYAQWQATSAWNRCPVSPWVRKYGAGNPIGIGALWCKKVFVDKKPCDEMDESQRKAYKPSDYAYFPCTYLDNPIFANDENFLRNLESYPAAIRDALKFGTWGIAGGYFSGAWDPAENVYDACDVLIQPWHKRWISCDWGFEHPAAVYWHYTDDRGVIRTYREMVVQHQPAEMLAESIVKNSFNDDGSMPTFQGFAMSHDAFASNATKTQGKDVNSNVYRMNPILRAAGLPACRNMGRDKLGRERLMYDRLAKRIDTLARTEDGYPIQAASWQIERNCTHLIETIPIATRREKEVEKIEEFLGDDPLQGSGYGLQMICGNPGKPSQEDEERALIVAAPTDLAKHLLMLKNTMSRQKTTEKRAWYERPGRG